MLGLVLHLPALSVTEALQEHYDSTSQELLTLGARCGEAELIRKNRLNQARMDHQILLRVSEAESENLVIWFICSNNNPRKT